VTTTPAGSEPLLQVFTMQLRPGAAERYRELHRAVWPELERELHECGVRTFEIFEADPLLVVYSLVDSDDAWQRVWSAEVNARWDVLMKPLLVFEGDEIVSTQLQCVYRLEPPEQP
jgi:L-rhamnose mutarotase